MTPRRVLLLSHEPPGAVSGNQRALTRFAAGLRERGLEVEVASLAEREVPAISEQLQQSPPDLIHGLHAFRTGPAALEIAGRLQKPLVITVSGTDLDVDYYHPERRGQVLEVLRRAAAITVATRDGAERLRCIAGGDQRVFYIPKGIAVPLELPRGVREEPFLFLLPAGFRPVKNNLFAIKASRPLAGEFPGFKLRLIGPVLDESYYQEFAGNRGAFPHVEEVGIVPIERMPFEYARASVVLNVSHSENGSHTVLEAMAAGKAVLASDIPGNREFISFSREFISLSGDRWDAASGLLYRATISGDPPRCDHDSADFLNQARRLLREPKLRRRIGENARRYLEKFHLADREITILLNAYELALAQDS